jgi:hypothetical protein
VEYVSPHNLRHFAVSFALRTGAKIAEAAEMAGHSDPMTTSRVYSHSLPGVARQVADNVSAAYGKATSGKAPESEWCRSWIPKRERDGEGAAKSENGRFDQSCDTEAEFVTRPRGFSL